METTIKKMAATDFTANKLVNHAKEGEQESKCIIQDAVDISSGHTRRPEDVHWVDLTTGQEMKTEEKQPAKTSKIRHFLHNVKEIGELAGSTTLFLIGAVGLASPFILFGCMLYNSMVTGHMLFP